MTKSPSAIDPSSPPSLSSHAQKRWAFVALISGATGIGFAPILVRLTDTGPSATAFYRVLIALPLLWWWSIADQRRHPSAALPKSSRAMTRLAACGLLFAADLSIWHWSLRFTTVANSTLLTNVAPIFVTVGAWVFLREKITMQFIFGMILAIIGGALLVGFNAELGRQHLLGDLLSILAAIFYGGYLLLLRVLRREFRTPIIMARVGVFSCAAFGVIALCSGDAFAPTHPSGWLAVLALALVSHVGGQTLITYGFGHLPASFSSVTLLWQPVVAAAVAWAILHEPLDWMDGAGGLIVLAGIALASGRVGFRASGDARQR